ncbi:MAG: hypothetical protein QGG54_05970 [Gammaproteobacteria bacterium]|jgi:hypothetical protein|nr:hypothetical protein [Chromatiales bacterium]MDP6414561.1 hypothetical protein [Gammaproteobacteria bacterium]MDP6673706.1 hypothetical protein [Gammaproteobacteria bacterium]
MDKKTAEQLVLALEKALQNLKQANHIARSGGDRLDLISFHELCAKTTDEIDQHLLTPVYNQFSGLHGQTLKSLETEIVT